MADVAEAPVPEIQEHRVVRDVVGHVEVRPAVAVEFRQEAESERPGGVVDARLAADLVEDAPVVAVEEVPFRRVARRVEVEGHHGPELERALADVGGIEAVPHVAAHVQIEVAVAIVVGPGRARPESLEAAQARSLRGRAEGALPSLWKSRFVP